MIGAFRIDLLDPVTGNKKGSAPITSATQVTRSQGLDRIGSWGFDMSAIDAALEDIEGADFQVFWLHGGETFDLGQCSYLKHSIQAGGDGPVVKVSASGKLRDLTRQTVLQRSFEGATDDINDVLAEIVPLRSGWALGQVDTMANAAPLDFWYETIFDSVKLLAETFGKHFREGSIPKTLDFGAFGSPSGVLAVLSVGGQRELPPSVYSNPNLCHITSLEVAYQGDQVVNRLVPFGGAVGVATIDLSETTVTQSGYPVNSAALPGGGSYYYLQDAASIAEYGLTERRFLRKDLRPISNSPAAREYAANVLYEAALASLLNLKNRQTIYNMAVTGLRPGQVRVGDKINVLYRGWANTPAGEKLWLDVDSDTQAGQGKAFYVLEIDETFGDDVTTKLTINENAVSQQTTEDLLANTIRAFEQSQIHVQPTISRYTVGPYTKRVSASPAVNASFSFKLGVETLNVWYVKIQVTGEPLKSSIQSVAGQSTTTPSGGGSTTPSGGGSTTPSGGGGTTPTGYLGGHSHYLPGGYWTGDTQWAHTHDTPDHAHSTPSHQHSTPNHQHTFTPNISTTYGIYQDSVRPDNLTIKVNGTTVAGGVILSSSNNYTYELDITSQILAASSLQQEHTITIECNGGRGEIVFQAQVLAVIQGISV